MRRPRRNHTAAFKAKVALAAARARSGPRSERQAMMDRTAELLVTRQCRVLALSRSSVYYTPKPIPEADLALMRRMGIEALYQRKSTSRRHPEHAVFPYLLRGLTIDRPNQVWAMDFTYLPMKRSFVYLAVVLDWATRRVLSWRLTNTLTADFCCESVEEAIAQYGTPEIFNTDQGCQREFKELSQHRFVEPIVIH